MNSLIESNSDFQNLLNDPAIEDILLRPSFAAFFRGGQWHGPLSTPASLNEENLWALARSLAEDSSLTLSLTQPVVDSIWHAGEASTFRAHIAIPPFVEFGPEITLRRIQREVSYQLSDYFSDPSDAHYLRDSFVKGDSCLICGVTGSGKSSLLSCLLRELPINARVLLLEDTKELSVPNVFSSRLLTRSNQFGFREGVQWGLPELLRESLRMRPERLILGECRGPEAKTIAEALATGHRGIATTLHASSARAGMERFSRLAGISIDPSQKPLWDVVLVIDSDGERRFIKEFARNTKR